MIYYHLLITTSDTLAGKYKLCDVIAELLPINITLTDHLYDPIKPDDFHRCIKRLNIDIIRRLSDKSFCLDCDFIGKFYAPTLGPLYDNGEWCYVVKSNDKKTTKELAQGAISFHSLDVSFDSIQSSLLASSYNNTDILEELMNKVEIVDFQNWRRFINEWLMCCMSIIKADITIWNYLVNPGLTEGSISAVIQCKSKNILEGLFKKADLDKKFNIQFINFQNYVQRYLHKTKTKSFPISKGEREFLCIEIANFAEYDRFNDPKWLKWYSKNYL